MKTRMKIYALFTSILLLSCATYYDHYTLTETVMTKVMVENLIDTSTEPYENHEFEVNALQQQLQKMWLYEKTKEKNLIMQEMWGLLNSERASLQTFLKTWKAQHTMSPVFVEEFAPEILRMFDLMIAYESKKDQKSENALSQILHTVLN